MKDLRWFALQGSIKLNEWKVEAGWGMIVVLSLIELSAFIGLGPLAPRPPTNSTHLFAVCSAYQLSWTWLPVIHFKLWPCCNIFSVKLKLACGFTLTAVVKPHATPFKCIFIGCGDTGTSLGPCLQWSSGAKDSLMLISMHLSPWAASCLPQLLIHFLFFSRLSSPSSFVPFNIVCFTFFCLPTSLYFLVKKKTKNPKTNRKLPATWRDKIKGMGMWRKWQFPICYHFGCMHAILSAFSLTLFTLCVYSGLIFTCCLREDKIMTPYSEKQKRGKI